VYCLDSPADGFLSVTAVPHSGPVVRETYSVAEAVTHGERVWQVRKLNGRSTGHVVRKGPVSCGPESRDGERFVCSCRSNRDGRGPQCYHLKAVAELVKRQLLGVQKLQGA
jgi:hypothetical protein